MSHFSLLVALPPSRPENVADALDEALAPFDADSEVEPYCAYVENWPDEYGRALNFFREHPDVKPAGLDELDVAAVLSAYMEDTVHEESAQDVSAVRFYRVLAYNQQATWDWWQVGGRWTGYFPVKPGQVGDLRLFTGSPGVFGTQSAPGRVDGGPRGLLDFEAMRTSAATAGAAEYDRWTEVMADLPDAQPWEHFLALHKTHQTSYPLARAQSEYQAQPRVQRARSREDFDAWTTDLIAAFAVSREDYIQRAAQRAVPGYAYLRLDGAWEAPGQMGWFGISSDREEDRTAYLTRINRHLDSLDTDTVIAAVDCHI